MCKCNCNDPKDCRKPEDFETKPEECSPDQICKCHGDADEHPCEKKSDKE